MIRVIPFLLAIVFTLPTNAQQNLEKDQIKGVIDTFFKALHNGDSLTMSKTLHKDIKIQTTATNKEGIKLLMEDSREKLLTNVANKNPKVTYLEKLLDYDIKIDGNLASAWTPYEFYINGNFSHCGANSFQFFNNNGTWEIIYLVDMRRKEGCKPSIKQ